LPVSLAPRCKLPMCSRGRPPKFSGEVFLRCVLYRDGRRRYGQRPGARPPASSPLRPLRLDYRQRINRPLAIPNSYVFDNQKLPGGGLWSGIRRHPVPRPSVCHYDMKTSTGPFFEASDPSVADWVNMSTVKGKSDRHQPDRSHVRRDPGIQLQRGTSSSSVRAPAPAGLSLVGLGLGRSSLPPSPARCGAWNARVRLPFTRRFRRGPDLVRRRWPFLTPRRNPAAPD